MNLLAQFTPETVEVQSVFDWSTVGLVALSAMASILAAVAFFRIALYLAYRYIGLLEMRRDTKLDDEWELEEQKKWEKDNGGWGY